MEKYQKDLIYPIAEYLDFDLDGFGCDITYLSQRIVKVRKNHYCGSSDKLIKKGEYARFDKAIVDGELASSYTSIKWLDKEIRELDICRPVNKEIQEPKQIIKKECIDGQMSIYDFL